MPNSETKNENQVFFPPSYSVHEWKMKTSDNSRLPDVVFTSDAKASPLRTTTPLKFVRELQLDAEERRPSKDASAQLLFTPVQTTPCIYQI